MSSIGVTSGVFDAFRASPTSSWPSITGPTGSLDAQGHARRRPRRPQPRDDLPDRDWIRPRSWPRRWETADGLLDLAVLNEGSHDISIFLNNGKGGFITMPRVDAGNNPTGLAVADVNGDGIPDLLVSNANGDLLILIGKGDGAFQPYQRADLTVSLAVGDLTGNGQTGLRAQQHVARPAFGPVLPQASSLSFLQGRAERASRWPRGPSRSPI